MMVRSGRSYTPRKSRAPEYPLAPGASTNGAARYRSIAARLPNRPMSPSVASRIAGCTARSAAAAPSACWPGLSRAMIVRKVMPVSLRNESRPRTSGSVSSGTMTSNARPISGPEKTGGMTPTIVNATPSNAIVRPIASRLPPKRRCEKPELITATVDRSSRCPNVRPTRAGTPSVSNNEPLAHMPSTSSVSPPDARLNRVNDQAALDANGSGRCSICFQTA